MKKTIVDEGVTYKYTGYTLEQVLEDVFQTIPVTNVTEEYVLSLLRREPYNAYLWGFDEVLNISNKAFVENNLPESISVRYTFDYSEQG